MKCAARRISRTDRAKVQRVLFSARRLRDLCGLFKACSRVEFRIAPRPTLRLDESLPVVRGGGASLRVRYCPRPPTAVQWAWVALTQTHVQT